MTPTGVLPQASVLAYRERSAYAVPAMLAAEARADSLARRSNATMAHLHGWRRSAYELALNGSGPTRTIHGPGGVDYTVTGGHRSCVTAAAATLYGSTAAYYNSTYVPQTLQEQALAIALNTPEVAVATGRWSACMRKAIPRSSYPEPGAAQTAMLVLFERADSASERRRANAVAVRTAVADARCGYSTHMFAAYAIEFHRVLRGMPRQKYTALVHVMASNQEAWHRATELLSHRHGSPSG